MNAMLESVPLEKFESKSDASDQKIRGGYYTPSTLAEYLVSILPKEKYVSVLEPSCGDGEFVLPLIKHLTSPALRVTAVEVLATELDKARKRVASLNRPVRFVRQDFLDFYGDQIKSSYDLVIGNPPYIRFQHLNQQSKLKAQSFLAEAGYKKNKLTNAWAVFTQLCIELLAPGGDLVFVIPVELLQVKYAGQLRDRLMSSFNSVDVVLFDNPVFPGITQEVVILLARGKAYADTGATREPNIHFSTYPSGLDHLDLNRKRSSKRDLNEAGNVNESLRDEFKFGKWTKFFIDRGTRTYLTELIQHPSVSPLVDFAKISVGIVTGRNKYFIIDQDTADRYDLHDYLAPILGRTTLLKTTRFTHDQFDKSVDEYPAFLLDMTGTDDASISDGLRDYLSLGRDHGIHTGYKCRIRKKWYEIPGTHMSDGFLFRQVYKYPLLVSNSADVLCTDTIHRVTVNHDSVLSIDDLSSRFFNSLTLVWSELLGRSYGGGVLELEPREAEHLPIVTGDINIDHDKLNSLLMCGSINEALDYADSVILKARLGMSDSQILVIRTTWDYLRDRRLNRTKS